MNQDMFRKYSFAWVTIGFLLLSMAGHWIFGWFAFVEEQQGHGATAAVGPFVVQMLRDTFENWQSEFLQVLWQVAGLTLLLFVGSPQSRDSEERAEAKLDEILRRVDPEAAEGTIAELKRRYPSK